MPWPSTASRPAHPGRWSCAWRWYASRRWTPVALRGCGAKCMPSRMCTRWIR